MLYSERARNSVPRPMRMPATASLGKEAFAQMHGLLKAKVTNFDVARSEIARALLFNAGFQRGLIVEEIFDFLQNPEQASPDASASDKESLYKLLFSPNCF